MPKYSARSQERLNTCHEDLQKVFNEVIRWIDCTILYGHRGKEEQDKFYKEGKSQKQWPNGEHNSLPSRAADVIPYPIDWGDRERMTLFAGFVLGIAKRFGIELRWGGDWNRNWEVQDNVFDDLTHFELVQPTNDQGVLRNGFL